MKRKWLYAIAGVVGAAAGAAVYLWNKKQDDEDEQLSIVVSPAIPDEWVNEARSAGCFVAEACEGEDIEVQHVCEFASCRVYDVYAGESVKKVLVDDDGAREIGIFHSALLDESDTCCNIAGGECSC